MARRDRGDGAGAPLARLLDGAAAALLDLALPRACAACARPLAEHDVGLVCGCCWARLALLPAPRCVRCGHPTWGRTPCRWCAALPPFVRAGRSVCWATAGSGRAIVHALKYAGWANVADGMAARMARLDWPPDVLEERAAVVPVPLAASKARQRGYNQCERLAHALAAHWHVPVWSDALARTRETRTQTRLGPDERAGNVRGAFLASRAARAELRGAHVVLVDDVVTTGATLVACAAALRDGGARVVSFVTFGRAPALGDRC